MTNLDQLRALMAQHDLTRADVARLLGLPVKNYTHSSVQSWLAGKRNMPAVKLELLRLRLQADYLQKQPITEVHMGARRTIYAEPTANTDSARE